MRDSHVSLCSTRRVLVLTICFLFGGTLLWTGCDLMGTTESDTGEPPTMSLLLTDAPAESIQKAEITIETIYLQGAGDTGRDTLLDQTTEVIDLLKLRDRTMDLVSGDTLSPGTYSQLRLVLGSVKLTTDSGIYTTASGPGAGSLICPSCSESGLKIKLPDGGFTVDEGNPSIGDMTVLLDFDVSQSFGHRAGQSGQWVMNPVITATRTETSGSIEGSVTFASDEMLPDTCGSVNPSVQDFAPLLRSVETDSVVKSTTVNADSTFEIKHLGPGAYTASYVDSADIGLQDTVVVFKAAASPSQPEISTAETTTLNYEVSSASCVVVQ